MENKSAREDLIRLNQQVKDAERSLKRSNDELELAIRERHREYLEEIHSLKNKLEVAEYKEKDALVKADKLEERNKRLNDELSKERLRALDLEKENQILIEQVIALREEAGQPHHRPTQGNDRRDPHDKGRPSEHPKPHPKDPLDDIDMQIPSNLIDSKFGRLSKMLKSHDNNLLNSQKKGLSSLNSKQDEEDTRRENEELREMVALMKEEMLGAQRQVELALKVPSLNAGERRPQGKVQRPAPEVRRRLGRSHRAARNEHRHQEQTHSCAG